MKTYRTLLYCLLFLSLSYFQSSGAESCSEKKREATFRDSIKLVLIIRQSYKDRDVETEVNLLNKKIAKCKLSFPSLNITPQMLNDFKTSGYKAEEYRTLQYLNNCGPHLNVQDEILNYEFWAKKLRRSPAEIELIKNKHSNRLALNFIDKSNDLLGTKASELACIPKQVEPQTKIGVVKTKNNNDMYISVVSEEAAQQLFKEAAAKTHIPFKYPEDGCYARAHEMAILLEHKCIKTGKVFIEGDLRVETKNKIGRAHV